MTQVNIGEKYSPPITQVDQVGKLISALASNLYIIAGVVLLVLIVWGGFAIIQGAGSSDREQVGRGKRILLSAIVGFLIIFVSYWIIQLIEVITGIKIV